MLNKLLELRKTAKFMGNPNVCEMLAKKSSFLNEIVLCLDWNGAKECTSCRYRKMLKHEYLVFTCKGRRRYSRERARCRSMK